LEFHTPTFLLNALDLPTTLSGLKVVLKHKDARSTILQFQLGGQTQSRKASPMEWKLFYGPPADVHATVPQSSAGQVGHTQMLNLFICA